MGDDCRAAACSLPSGQLFTLLANGHIHTWELHLKSPPTFSVSAQAHRGCLSSSVRTGMDHPDAFSRCLLSVGLFTQTNAPQPPSLSCLEFFVRRRSLSSFLFPLSLTLSLRYRLHGPIWPRRTVVASGCWTEKWLGRESRLPLGW